MLKKTLLTASLAFVALGAGNAMAGDDISVTNNTQRVIAIGGHADTDSIVWNGVGSGSGIAGTAVVGSVAVWSGCDCGITIENRTRDVVAIGSSVVGSVFVGTH